MHGTWKECVQPGKVRSSSPSSNSHKHTAQVPSSPLKLVPFSYLWAGMRWAAELLLKLLEFSSTVAVTKLCCLCRLDQHTAMQWCIVTKIAADPAANRRMAKLWLSKGGLLFDMDWWLAIARVPRTGLSSNVEETIIAKIKIVLYVWLMVIGESFEV